MLTSIKTISIAIPRILVRICCLRTSLVVVINEIGINEIGINESGINEIGINEIGINESGIKKVVVSVVDAVLLSIFYPQEVSVFYNTTIIKKV
ncbi:hypothetical protein [Methanosarcina spelaei]|nr:hypothetical protein [Methanosarcina spelaei]